MENYDYEAAAGTIKIEDITSNDTNRKILRKLKANDAEFDDLVVVSSRDDDDNNEYCPEDTRSLGWVGYYIGKNTKLQGLQLRLNPLRYFHNRADIEEFFRGVNCNRSIQKIHFHNTDLSGGEIFQSLGQLFEKNGNLSKLVVNSCTFGAGCARQLSMTLRGCSKSLKHLKLGYNQMGGEQLVDIIDAFSVHPQLEKLELGGINVRRNECVALANLLGGTSNMRTLLLIQNGIDDEGVNILVGALANSRLSGLYLSGNRITARRCQSLVAMLENVNSNLEELYLTSNNIRDEGAPLFANAFATNRKLKTLDLDFNGITVEGWSSFSKILCDTSSVNNTFLSNHTLESLGVDAVSLPSDVASSLDLNRSSEDKKEVAIKKIIKHHRDFDMQPFFEWDLKVLPIAIKWFERARSIEDIDETVIGKNKLGAIYQFIRAMPEVFEPVPGAAGEKRKRGAVDG